MMAHKSRKISAVVVMTAMVFLVGCSAFSNPPIPEIPEGEIAHKPRGYMEHCFREPESEFCP